MMTRFASRAVVASLLAAIAAVAGCQRPAQDETAKPATPAATQSAVARGQYLVTILACNDCHTPLQMGPNGPAPDMSRMLSGHPEAMKMPLPPKLEAPWTWAGAGTNTAFAGPWGVTYSANITPDQNTGLGIWTEEMFLNAMRQGKHMGTSREIQPPMPWRWYGQMTEDDLKAVFAYLKTVPPLANHAPDWEPPGGVGQ